MPVSRLFRSVAGASLLTCLSFAAAQTPTPAKPQRPVLAVWTELVGDDHTAPDPQPAGHTVLRVITEASACPAATADGHPLRLAVRQASSAAFPVTTCQATPPAAARTLTVAGVTLATMPAHLERIIVIGDTGCRLKGPLVQDCNDVKRIPTWSSTSATTTIANRPALRGLRAVPAVPTATSGPRGMRTSSTPSHPC